MRSRNKTILYRKRFIGYGIWIQMFDSIMFIHILKSFLPPSKVTLYKKKWLEPVEHLLLSREIFSVNIIIFIYTNTKYYIKTTYSRSCVLFLLVFVFVFLFFLWKKNFSTYSLHYVQVSRIRFRPKKNFHYYSYKSLKMSRTKKTNCSFFAFCFLHIGLFFTI